MFFRHQNGTVSGDNAPNPKSIVATESSVLTNFDDGRFVEFRSDYMGGYRSRTPFNLANVKSAACSWYNSIAVKQDGTVITWYSQDSSRGTVPAGLSNVRSVDATDDLFSALKEDGTVVQWPSEPSQDGGIPEIPAGLANVKSIASGPQLTVALKEDGGVVAWGPTIVGEAAEDSPLAVPEEARSGVVAIAVGHRHILALKNNGTVIAWGRKSDGSTEIPISARANVKAVAANKEMSMALKEDGSVVVWPPTNSGAKNIPAGLAGVQAISAGWNFAAALVDTSLLVPDLKLYEVRFDEEVLEEEVIELANDVSTLSFGNEGIESSKSIPVRIWNAGLGDIRNLSISVTGENASDFEIDDAPPTTIQSNESKTYEVFFSPKGRGPRAATLNITSNDPDDGAIAISLRGNGIDVPQISVTSGRLRLENDTSNLSFGLVARDASKVITFVIKNEGGSSLDNLSARIGGKDLDDFAIVQHPVGSLMPGKTTALEVLFDPDSSGMKRAEVMIKSNDGDDNPFVVHVSGKRGRASEIAVYNKKLSLSSGKSGVSFGTVKTAKSKTIKLTILNQGNASLTGIKAGIGAGGGKEFTIIKSPAKLCAPGQSTSVTVKYTPSRITASQATLRISSNDKDERFFDIRLSGTGGLK